MDECLEIVKIEIVKILRLPIISIIIFTLLFIFLTSYIPLEPIPDIDMKTAIETENSTESRLAYLRWGASFFLVGVALLWNFGISLKILKRGDIKYNLIRTIITIFILAVIGIPLSNNINGNITSKINEIIKDYGSFDIGLKTNPMTILAFIVVIVAIPVSLSSLMDISNSDATNIVSNLRNKIYETRISLYSTSVLLIVGVLQIFLQYSVPAYFFRGIHRDALLNSAATIAAITGIIFSSLLIILYVPLGMFQKGQILDLQDKVNAEEFKELQLENSTLSDFKKVISLILPSIFGIFIKYFESLNN